MALRKIGGAGGPISKWDAVGKRIAGFFLSMRDGKQFAGNAGKSKLAMFRLLDGQVITAGAPTALAGRLAEILTGTYVEVTYLGLERGQAGVQYKNFDVEADDERRLTPAEISAALATPRPAANPAAAPGAPVFPALAQHQAPATPAGSVEALEQKLRDAKGAQIGDLLVNALKGKYQDPIAYLSALAEVLKANGIAV